MIFATNFPMNPSMAFNGKLVRKQWLLIVVAAAETESQTAGSQTTKIHHSEQGIVSELHTKHTVIFNHVKIYCDEAKFL